MGLACCTTGKEDRGKKRRQFNWKVHKKNQTLVRGGMGGWETQRPEQRGANRREPEVEVERSTERGVAQETGDRRDGAS